MRTGDAGQGERPTLAPSHANGLGESLHALLAPWLHPRAFTAGQVLWRKGGTPEIMVVLRSGYVKSYRLLPSGRPVTLFLFGPGDVFGFLPLLDGTPYPGTVEVVEDAEALVMTRDDLQRALRTDPDLAVSLLVVLGRRLRAAMDTIEGMCGQGVQRRVAAALLDFLEDDGPHPIIRLPVAAQEFANLLGVSPETVSRTLTCLEDGGALTRLGRRRYQVLDLRGLRDAALAAERT